MPRLAANISLLFTELAFLDRFAAAADHGFKGVEILVPYDHAADAVAAQLALHGLECVLINTPYGPTAGGHTGLGALPGREHEFAADARRALDYAQAIGCRRLHALAGIPPAGFDPSHCRGVFVDNLQALAGQAGEAGTTVLIEPLNTFDFPGYFLTHQEQAHAIVHDVGAPNLKVQMDFYHCQMTEGFVTDKVRRFIDTIGHFQIAGVPGRIEPDAGELNHAYVFALVDAIGYDGWVGAEYNPRADTASGLAWAEPYGITL